MHPIPVYILSGFLGAGKTTFLNYILHNQEKYKIAVIENEFGNTTLDTRILSHNTASLHITTLKNGCICCNSRSDLENSLTELLQKIDNQLIEFNQLIIECTGMADPGPIIQTFLTHEPLLKRFSIKGTITIVDVVHAPYHFKHFNVTQAQIGIADLILLSKVDLITTPLEPFIKQLRYMNSLASIHYVKQGQFDLNLLDTLDAFNHQLLRKHSAFTCTSIIDNDTSYDTQVNSFIIYREKPFDPHKFSQLMNRILNVFQKQLIRYKGIVHIQDNSKRLILQGIHQLYNSEWGEEWLNTEAPYTEIVFIGIQLPENEFYYFFNQI